MLPEEYRLKKKKDFQKVIQKGKKTGEGFLILRSLKNKLKGTRIGFVVSQKVAKRASLRNKIKRRLREAIRPNLGKIKSGYDLIFFTKKGIEEKDFWQIKEAVIKLLQRAKLLKR